MRKSSEQHLHIFQDEDGKYRFLWTIVELGLDLPSVKSFDTEVEAAEEFVRLAKSIGLKYSDVIDAPLH